MRNVAHGRHDDPHAEEAASAAVSKHARRPSEAGPKGLSRLEVLAAHLPLLTAILSVLLVWATGFTERSFIGTALEDRFYGYFFRSYPVLLFAMIYGVARIVTAAVTEPGARRGWRLVSTPVAVALFLLAGFHPTFGGIIARTAFATGGMSFLQGQSAGLSMVLGAGAAAFMYGLVLGLAIVLACLRFSVEWRAFGRAVLRLVALWLGTVILLAAQRWALESVGGWPFRPLHATAALQLALGLCAGFLPHALVLLWCSSGKPRHRSPATPSARGPTTS
jgi:hypothetical protein